MKILLRLPNWLGDGVMATPTIETLRMHYQESTLILVGSPVVCALFKDDPNTITLVDDSKKAKSRLWATYQLARQIGRCDLAITLTNHFYSAFLLYCTQTPVRIGYAKFPRTPLLTHALSTPSNVHQVERYYHLLHACIPNLELAPPPLKLNAQRALKPQRIGLNPGAAYGSAKRWKPEYFAQVGAHFLAEGYEVYLFGARADLEVVDQIMRLLPASARLFNLCNQTTLAELIEQIGTLSLFITNDSGPMHIATALQVPLIALFGPTNMQETSPWQHPHACLINKNLPCAPCKKRVCPLKNRGNIKPHACMDTISPQEVIQTAQNLLIQSL
ncbi:lipopolysaccharide heptosyltransferase II [Helicobacter cynogastricus]|uniref:lipopolysaccharide heptosyltransferase II n=1 Tax=Helicobacter cynogastricus TaxID=329937 RepID=UPI000CF0E977|nr:lipopolysaccharide heptosyltransferase II [Helicobacter cynogastricus]